MIRNYFKIAFRNLRKHKGYGFINISGLTLGLASCLVIFQFVAFEISFDKFHKNKDDIYRILQSTPLRGEAFEMGGAFTGYAFAPALNESVPEIRYITRVHPEYGAAIISTTDNPERVFEEERVFYADKDFLRIFSFPLVSENTGKVLETGTVLISESAAKKFFGSKDPMGQVLKVAGQIQKNYLITGVLKDIPANSHLQFDYLLPMEDLIREGYTNEPEGGWSWNNFVTYVQLYPHADLNLTIRKMTRTYYDRRGEMLEQQARKVLIWAQPLNDVHLNAEIDAPGAVMGSYRTVYFFTIIGLVTLLIALVNYVNLETARAFDRAREVGVRKVAGAHKRQLIVQFMCESAVMNLIAAFLAVVLAEFLSPVMNELAGVQLSGALWLNPSFWAAFLITFIVGTILAGLYPAFILSSFKPITALKGKTGAFTGQLWMRRGLVVLQFAASVVLIGGTAIVYDQLNYMKQIDLGLNIDQVLAVNGPRIIPEGSDNIIAMNTFIQEVKRIPAIRQVATSTTLPGKGFNWNGASVRKATDDPASTIRAVATYIDTNFAALYGLELVAGNGFADITLPVPDDVPWPVIANETAVRTLGYKSPSDAINQALDFGGYDSRIVGVVKDFNWSSAHTARQNIFFGPVAAGDILSIRVSTGDIANTISSVEAVYKRLFPGNVFIYKFVDETFNEQYKSEERFAKLFSLFAAFAIVIACLGLFGLAAFTIRQRTKEIGVRKVLGATVPGVVTLLSKDFLVLVLIAIIIASPAVYYLMSSWLEGFAYRTKIGPGIFLMTGLLVLAIAILTVSYQSIRAALTNPSESLKYE